MNQLRVHSVSDLNFGRHHGVSFPDLNHDFVVVFGRNESGKSTLAEYLTWSIGGPWRRYAEGSDRFETGTGQLVSGRLVGSLENEVVDINSKFSIRKSGTPNDLRDGTVGGRTLKGEDFGIRFNQLTADDYRWIYRLYGVELGKIGTGEEFSNLFSAFTTGLSLTENPRLIFNGLVKKKESLTSLRKEIDKRRKEVEKQIREAGKNPGLLADQETKLEETESGINRDAKEIERINKRIAILKKALSGLSASVNRNAAQEGLNALDIISNVWLEVIPLIGDVRETQVQIKKFELELVQLRENANNGIAKRSFSMESIASQSPLNASERAEISAAFTRVSNAESRVLAAETTIQNIQILLNNLASEITALSSAVGFPSERLEELLRKAQLFTDLQTDASSWNVFSDSEITLRAKVESAQAGLNDRQNTSTVGPSDSGSLGKFLVPGVLVSFVAIGLVANFNTKISSIAGIFAALIFGAIMRRTAGSKKILNGKFAPGSGDETEWLQARRDLAGVEEQVLGFSNKVLLPLSQFGVVAPAPNTAVNLLRQLSQLATFVDNRRSQSEELGKANTEIVDAEINLRNELQSLKDLLEVRQIVDIPSTGYSDEWLIDYENAILAVDLLNIKEADYQKLMTLQESRLEPIKDEILGQPWPVIDAKFAMMAELAESRAIAVRNLKEAEIAARSVGVDENEIKEILERFPSEELLTEQLLAFEGQKTEVSVNRDRLLGDSRDLVREIENLKQSEILPALQLKLGEIMEEIDENDQQGKIFSIAVGVFANVIGRFERDNQDPLIKEAQKLISSVVADWGDILFSRTSDGKVAIEREGDGRKLSDSRLSDGGRALLFLGIRLAFAIKDAERRNIRLPLICDDPFIHFDDERTSKAIELFATISKSHQIIMFTCEDSTRDLAISHGAHLVSL